MKKDYEMNLCEGAILPKLIVYAVPLILSSLLQLLFNTADVIIVGRFSGSQALAAVGSTTSLINLLVNLFLGISIGANVLAARQYGAQDRPGVQETTHTSILVALIGGAGMVFLGNAIARPMLSLMGTPSDVLDQAVQYMSIYFLGMPGFMVFNFGAACLRAVGDTRRPLYFLTGSGVVNIILNLFFVIAFRMGVAGVALATIISQYLSAALILFCMCRTDGACHLELRRLRIYPYRFAEMMRIGLAAGFQSVMFNISNVLIQSSVNSFGSTVMAGNAAAFNVEGLIYVCMNAVTQTSLSFCSQNFGAQQFRRIDKIVVRCLCMVATVGAVLGWGSYLLGTPLLGLYTTDPEVLQYGLYRMSLLLTTYFICGLMDTMAGCVRGLGYSAAPTIVALLGACGFRILWIFTVFRMHHTLFMLYISYPISWVITVAAHLCCYAWIHHKIFPKKKVA